MCVTSKPVNFFSVVNEQKLAGVVVIILHSLPPQAKINLISRLYKLTCMCERDFPIPLEGRLQLGCETKDSTKEMNPKY